MSIMTPIGYWHLTGTPNLNGVKTVGNNETTPLSQTLLGAITKAIESLISETNISLASLCFTHTARLTVQLMPTVSRVKQTYK